MAASRIAQGLQEKVALGNLNSKRDWGFAPEYVEGMWRILQHDKAEDFVLATGETRTIREFSEIAFKEIGIDIEWSGKGENEIGVDKKSGITRIVIDQNYYRPTEVDLLVGDATKAKEKLNWIAKTKCDELAKLMVRADFELVKRRGY